MMKFSEQSIFGFMIGTRPEAIKLMPLIRELTIRNLKTIIYCSGQHSDLLDPIMKDLQILETINFEIMTENQTLSYLSSSLLQKLEFEFQHRKPNIMIVQGDTTSALITALACFYNFIPIAHVESGLRTKNRNSPFPEEMNRRILSQIASIHFAPTEHAQKNLISEGLDPDTIHITGNTVIDSLFFFRDHIVPSLKPYPQLQNAINSGKKILFVTAHRRENIGEGHENVCKACLTILKKYSYDFYILFSVHPNPNVNKTVRSMLSNTNNLSLLDPLPYSQCIMTMQSSYLIITDSGGIQEEAAALGIPVLITRTETERVELLSSLVSRLTGPDEVAIVNAVTELLDSTIYKAAAKPCMVFGDGQTSKRIANILLS